MDTHFTHIDYKPYFNNGMSDEAILVCTLHGMVLVHFLCALGFDEVQVLDLIVNPNNFEILSCELSNAIAIAVATQKMYREQKERDVKITQTEPYLKEASALVSNWKISAKSEAKKQKSTLADLFVLRSNAVCENKLKRYHTAKAHAAYMLKDFICEMNEGECFEGLGVYTRMSISDQLTDLYDLFGFKD